MKKQQRHVLTGRRVHIPPILVSGMRAGVAQAPLDERESDSAGGQGQRPPVASQRARCVHHPAAEWSAGGAAVRRRARPATGRVEHQCRHGAVPYRNRTPQCM